MSFPRPGDYQEAVQVPDAAFVDPALAALEPEATVLGLPRVLTGAFAVVFPLEDPRTGVRQVAARCFLTDVPGQRQRYAALSAHLARHDLPHLVGFDYQRQGIRAAKGVWPLLAMEWAEGTPLDAYLEEHHADTARVRTLADAWRAMLEALDAAQIAHGDVQHGNVLVQSAEAGRGGEAGDTPRLVLVDYDAMVVPALASQPAPETGHRNYQHPDRDAKTPGLTLDRFAGLAVYVALRALEEKPELWARYTTGENVLFRAADFYEPDVSPLFADLRTIPAVAPLAEILAAACYAPPERTPRVADALAGETDLSGTKPKRRGDPAAEAYDRQRQREQQRTPWETAAPFMLALGVAAGLIAVGWGSGVVGSAVLVASALAFVGLAVLLRARRPTVRRRARLLAELRQTDAFIARLRAQSTDLAAQRERIGTDLRALEAERLTELREEALEDNLKHHFIGEIERVEGLGHRVVVRMKAAGIRTAVHVTPDAVARATELSDAARQRVLLWRNALVAEYAGDLPTALPPSETQRLRRHRAHLRADLTARIQRTEQQIAVQMSERAEVAARRDALLPLPLGHYAAFLLRLRPLPKVTAPQAPPPADTPPAPVPADAAPPEASAPPDENAPWWQQHP